MDCISINYKNTSEEIRGKVNFTDSEKNALFEHLKTEKR